MVGEVVVCGKTQGDMICTLPVDHPLSGHECYFAEKIETFWRGIMSGHDKRDRSSSNRRKQPETDPSGYYSYGRVREPLWKKVQKQDPNAYKAPDQGERDEIPIGGDPPAGVTGTSYTGRGQEMASIAEVAAALGAANAQLSEAQGAVHTAIERIDSAVQLSGSALEGSGNDAVNTGRARLMQAKEQAEQMIQMVQEAIDQFTTYTAAL